MTSADELAEALRPFAHMGKVLETRALVTFGKAIPDGNVLCESAGEAGAARLNMGHFRKVVDALARHDARAPEGDGWRPIGTDTPRCVNPTELGDNGLRPLMVCRFPFTGAHCPIVVARLTSRGWMHGRRFNRLWFEPTHRRPLPSPPTAQP